MAGVEVRFDQAFFDSILRSSGVEALGLAAAQRVLAQAKATAPFDSGDYQAGLRIERAEAQYRTVFLVAGTDWKTLLVESKLGVLARALKSAGRS